MYRGKNNDRMHVVNQSTSFMNKSNLGESQTQILQKQVDNYTRKLEQEKRRFFRIQQNHREVLKELNQKNQQLQLLKTKKFKTEMQALRIRVKEKQKVLQKAIDSYNEALARNSSLKIEIDQLRKQKKNSSEVDKLLKQRIHTLKSIQNQNKDKIGKKKYEIQKLKSTIIQIKENNQIQSEQYHNNIGTIEGSFLNQSKTYSKVNINDNTAKNDTVDTHPIVKLRLKNTLQKNKQKLRLIEQYKKNMTFVWKAFQQMKNQSGISDLEQLTKSILKQQEQDMFIYHFIDKLTKNLETIKDTNLQIQAKIQQQKQINLKYRTILSSTSDAERNKLYHKKIIDQKMKTIYNFQNFVKDIHQQLISTLNFFGCKDYDNQIPNYHNIQSFLSQIQQIVSSLNVLAQKTEQPHTDEATRYSKAPPPIINDELKEKQDDRLIDPQKMRQFASDFLQKKKTKNKHNQE